MSYINPYYTDENNYLFYYDVNGVKYYSDVSAMIASTEIEKSTGISPIIKYFPKFDFIANPKNWSVEPELNVKEYFIERAKILESKYDKIYLSYSGGSDSHTALDAFISAGVKNITLIHTIDKHLYSNDARLEVFNDLKKKLHDRYYNTFKDLNYEVIGIDDVFLLDEASEEEYEENLKSFLGSWWIDIKWINSWFIWTKNNPSKILKNPNNSCLVFGFEKPKIIIKDIEKKDAVEKWFCVDYKPRHLQNLGFIPFENLYSVEYFFISDSLPELQIKTSWEKIKYIENNIKIDFDKNNDTLSNLFNNRYNEYYGDIIDAMGYQPLIGNAYDGYTKVISHEDEETKKLKRNEINQMWLERYDRKYRPVNVKYHDETLEKIISETYRYPDLRGINDSVIEYPIIPIKKII